MAAPRWTAPGLADNSQPHAADMAHAVGIDPFGEFSCDVRRPVVAEQFWLVQHPGAVAGRSRESQLQRVGDVLGAHGRAQLPCDDVAGEVVEHGRQVDPAPADDLEVGEVCLLHLVWPRCLVPELAGGLDDDEGRAGDEVMGLEQAIDGGFGHEAALLIGEAHRQFTW